MAGAHSDVDVRVAVGACLRECYRERLDRARRAYDAGISGRQRPRDLHHGGSDVERAIPASLRASVTGAIDASLGGAEGDSAREASGDD